MRKSEKSSFISAPVFHRIEVYEGHIVVEGLPTERSIGLDLVLRPLRESIDESGLSVVCVVGGHYGRAIKARHCHAVLNFRAEILSRAVADLSLSVEDHVSHNHRLIQSLLAYVNGCAEAIVDENHVVENHIVSHLVRDNTRDLAFVSREE
jgi:hypothetical protein